MAQTINNVSLVETYRGHKGTWTTLDGGGNIEFFASPTTDINFDRQQLSKYSDEELRESLREAGLDGDTCGDHIMLADYDREHLENLAIEFMTQNAADELFGEGIEFWDL